MTRSPLLQARGLQKTYGEGRTAVRAVREVTFAIAPGEIVLVMGPSGSGKSTLLSMLGGLLQPSAGNVLVGGEDLYDLPRRRLPGVRARTLGFVFQNFNLLGALTAEQNVLFPAGLIGRVGPPERERARALLDGLGLGARRRHLPRDLSGGEQQRVAVARALMNSPDVILADEPTGNLDSARGQEILMILHDLARDEGKAVLVVTHDPRAEEVADRILWLEDGSLRDRLAHDALWVRDPVCGMRVDAKRAVAETGGPDGRVVFCSRRCLERWAADPAAYAAEPAGPG